MLSLSADDGRRRLGHSPPGETMKGGRRVEGGPRNKRKGRITVFADLADPGERSRRIRTNTLKVETRGTKSDGIRRGKSIPSHLRAGIHHDPVMDRPAPAGCAVDVDNVQVLAPRGPFRAPLRPR
ncbi:MAG: hypothetical protein FJW90_07485 [Actinobacteria bacterium]|nr:hypothetical protein [Actinomycetota bacterium]